MTAAEIAERELRRNDRNVSRANPITGRSEIPVINITTPNPSPQRPRGPVFMSFSSSGALVRSSIVNPLRSSNISPTRSSNVSPLRTQREDSDIIVLEVCRAEEGLTDMNPNLENTQQKLISISLSMVELLLETSPS